MHLSPEEWGFFASLVGSIGTVVGYFGKRTKRVEQRTERVEEATQTLRPNGGSSLNDAIRRIEAAVNRLEGRFEQHLDDGEGEKKEWRQWRQSLEGRSRRR